MEKKKDKWDTENWSAKEWLITGFVIIIIAVLGYGFFWSSDTEEEKFDDFNLCIDYCLAPELELCISSSWISDCQRNLYISEEDYEDCQFELESCVEECKNEYRKES